MRSVTLRRIWGLARELGLSDEEVYTILKRETGKEHMTPCSDGELERVLGAIISIKDINAHRPGMATKRQLWKIHELEQALGWADEPKRLAAFVEKYYHVGKLEWLKKEQAICLIDSLKNILAKERRESHA